MSASSDPPLMACHQLDGKMPVILGAATLRRVRGNRQAMAGSLEGSVTLTMAAGRLRRSIIDSIHPELMPVIAPWTRRGENTALNCAVGRFDVHARWAVARSLLVDTARMRIVGGGIIDLAAQPIPGPSGPLIGSGSPVRRGVR